MTLHFHVRCHFVRLVHSAAKLTFPYPVGFPSHLIILLACISVQQQCWYIVVSHWVNGTIYCKIAIRSRRVRWILSRDVSIFENRLVHYFLQITWIIFPASERIFENEKLIKVPEIFFKVYWLITIYCVWWYSSPSFSLLHLLLFFSLVVFLIKLCFELFLSRYLLNLMTLYTLKLYPASTVVSTAFHILRRQRFNEWTNGNKNMPSCETNKQTLKIADKTCD